MGNGNSLLANYQRKEANKQGNIEVMKKIKRCSNGRKLILPWCSRRRRFSERWFSLEPHCINLLFIKCRLMIKGFFLTERLTPAAHPRTTITGRYQASFHANMQQMDQLTHIELLRDKCPLRANNTGGHMVEDTTDNSKYQVNNKFTGLSKICFVILFKNVSSEHFRTLTHIVNEALNLGLHAPVSKLHFTHL